MRHYSVRVGILFQTPHSMGTRDLQILGTPSPNQCTERCMHISGSGGSFRREIRFKFPLPSVILPPHNGSLQICTSDFAVARRERG